MKVYYAHSLHLYNTPQEKRDVELLEEMGYEVLNPNSSEVQQAIKNIKQQGNAEYMLYFEDLVKSCNAFAFRAHVDGKIPAGVAKEIAYAAVGNKVIFELPNLNKGRFLDVEETRQYLQYNGQR